MDTETKRLRWKCRRGMKELDTLLLRYLDSHYTNALEAHKKAFIEILEMQDPELWLLLVGKTVNIDRDIHDVVKALQQSSRT